MKKEKSLLLLMAAASVGAVHATPPASMGEEMGIVKVQEKGAYLHSSLDRFIQRCSIAYT